MCAGHFGTLRRSGCPALRLACAGHERVPVPFASRIKLTTLFAKRCSERPPRVKLTTLFMKVRAGGSHTAAPACRLQSILIDK